MWKSLEPVKKALPVQEFILSQLEKEWPNKYRHALLCPRQKIVNQTTLQLAFSKQLPTLILCTDETRLDEWRSCFQEYFGLENPEEYISELKLNSPLTAFNLITYSSFCQTVNISPEERSMARSYREYELASVSTWDQTQGNIGDLDAVKETEVMLNEEAIRQISLYKNKLLRFIELGEKKLAKHWLNKNSNKFIKKLKDKGIALFICDDSHEVTGIWAEAFSYVMQSFPNCHSLSLSPLRVKLSDLSPRNYQLQTSLFDSNPLEIKLPLLVRDNCLKAYLGLLAITVPSKEESQLLNNASRNLKEALSKVQDDTEVSTTLTQFVYQSLEALERDVPGHWAKRQEYVESVLNFVCYYSLSSSAVWKVFIDKLDEIEFNKNIPIIRDYIFRCLINSPKKKDHRIGEALIMAFRPLGYELNKVSIEQSTSLIPNILNRSINKEELLVKYLTEEFISLKRDLKAVIITDFIDDSSAAEIFPGNDFNSSSCGMTSILNRLERSPTTLQLNPIIIYGDVMYFNPKYKNVLGKEVENHASNYSNIQAKMKEENGYCYISILGNKNFSSFWTPLINTILKNKVSHTIIVGREFLSTKWDGINFNTYFNLSSATSELFGSRLLARMLMKDDGPITASHLWDFCSIMPEIELGMSDYYRISHRKEHSWHLSEDGEFEKGISYFHPGLRTNMKTLSLDLINEVNDTASRLILTRDRTHEMWLSKHDQDNFIREVLEISISSKTDPFKKFAVTRSTSKKSFQLDCKGFIESLCQCVINSVIEIEKMKDNKENVELALLVRRPGVYRVELSKCSVETKSTILSALQMLLAPINRQHYIVTISCSEAPKGNVLSRMFSDHVENFQVPFAIPEIFTKKEEIAIFMNHWQKSVSNDKMMGHRIPGVRQEVKQMIRKQKFILRPESRICQLLV